MVIYGITDKIKFHTRVGDVLSKLAGYHIPLTWIFTDLECYSTSKVLQGEEPIIISGKDLDLLIQDHWEVQIIWGVLSGFRLRPEDIDLSILPKAEDSDVWKTNYQIQHPQAECELVAWDSGATFFRSRNQEAMRMFSLEFPEAQTIEAVEKIHWPRG